MDLTNVILIVRNDKFYIDFGGFELCFLNVSVDRSIVVNENIFVGTCWCVFELHWFADRRQIDAWGRCCIMLDDLNILE